MSLVPNMMNAMPGLLTRYSQAKGDSSPVHAFGSDHVASSTPAALKPLVAAKPGLENESKPLSFTPAGTLAYSLITFSRVAYSPKEYPVSTKGFIKSSVAVMQSPTFENT